MPYIHEYYCTKCKVQVKENDTRCPICKSILASDGAIEIKKIKIPETKKEVRINIYKNKFNNLATATKEEKEGFEKHEISSTFPVWACIILHFITFGLFTLIYFGIKHGKLPKIDDDDPTTGRAIGFMFIPLYNIYWKIFFWLRMTDRINLQYKLRNKKMPINRVLVKITVLLGLLVSILYIIQILSPTFYDKPTLIFGLIPSMLAMIQTFVLMPVVIGITQSASNRLAKDK